MANSRKLKISLNDHLFNKTAPKGDRYRAEGFEAVEIAIEELASAVSEGTAYSAQYKDSYRKKENFIASDILSLDFDGGITTEEMLENPLVKRHASLLYATVNHSEEDHRFRIIFVLPRTIECANEMRWATKALSRRLGSDPRSTDTAHYFAGSHGCTPMLLDGSISPVLLDELIEDGRHPVKIKHNMDVSTAQSRSTRSIQGGEPIQLASGEAKPFDQIMGKTAVFCPFHMDHNPSAFIAETISGKFLRCSSCEQTWWAEGASKFQHDFSSFDKAVRDLKASPKIKLPDELFGLEAFMGSVEVSPKNIWLQNDRYLKVPDLMHKGKNEGLFFIKSPKGTGKTTFLETFLNAKPPSVSTTLYDTDDDTKVIPFNPSPSDPSVLVIGHRKALIGELCQRLRLKSYLDCKDSKGFFANQKRMLRLGICLDSLKMVQGKKYDVIVLDEVEQVLKHFLGKTVGHKRREIFEYFAALIASAKQVIALDADLGWLSFVTLNALKNDSSSGQGDAERIACPVHILLNDNLVVDRKLEVFGDKSHLIADLKHAAQACKRLFVTSNSKALIDDLHEALAADAKKEGRAPALIAITSDNSTSKEGQVFIKSIKDSILEFQVVLCSPSLGTGIDITFDGQEQKIDCVYGFFENGITNHFDIDQQLCRVRHPKAVKVWVSPRCFNFETAFEVVHDDVLNADLFASMNYGIPQSGSSPQNLQVIFLTMATLAAIKDRASVNALSRNFIAAKREMGWEIDGHGRDEAMAQIGLDFRERGRALADQKYYERIMSARTLKQSEFEKLRRRMDFENGELSLDEKFNFWRTAMEVFYRRPVNSNLISFDCRGRQRGRIWLYEALKRVAQQERPQENIVLPYDRKLLKRTHLSVLPDIQARMFLLHGLLETTPLYCGGKFLTDVEYCQGDLKHFVEQAIKLKPYLEGQLGVTIAYNAKKKPIQLLGTVLTLVGVSHEITRQSKDEKKGRKRYYAIRSELVHSLEHVCKRREEIDSWPFINEQYGFEDTLEDIEYLSGQAA